jgi:hypothetical protein
VLDLPPLDPGIEIVVASRGMSKGIAQTEGPQLVAKPFVQLGSFQLGAQWKNVSSAAADGEGAAFVSVSPKLGEFQLGLSVAHKFQTRVREPTDDHSWEFTGSVTRRFGKLALRVVAVYSPDDLGSAKRSLFVEVIPVLELGKTTRLSGGIGRRSRANGDDYSAFNAGLAKTIFEGVTVDVRWYDTNRSGLSYAYRGRGVLSARLAF